ncbi:MAG: hypothetical protein R2867_10440 [Caldilineaceae bacterium]
MKITKLECIPIQRRAMVLKLYTDEGLIGYGEPMNYEHWRVVAQAVDDMAEYLIGKDPLQIEDHWQAMYRSSYSRSMPVLVGALSGIEMAMWDIFGKVVGMPIWKLLGSVRKRIRVYTGIGGNTPEECAASARAAVDKGFRAVKMVVTPTPIRFVDTPRAIDAMVAWERYAMQWATMSMWRSICTAASARQWPRLWSRSWSRCARSLPRSLVTQRITNRC